MAIKAASVRELCLRSDNQTKHYFSAHSYISQCGGKAMLKPVFHITTLLLTLSCGAFGQSQGLSKEEQEEILKAHNYYRRTVDPISTNMLIMVGVLAINPHT